MSFTGKVQFKSSGDSIILSTQRVEDGVWVDIYRNGKTNVRDVPDIILARDIGYPMYQAFYKVIKSQGEQISPYDFNPKILNVKVPEELVNISIQKLKAFPTDSYIKLWRYTKSLHAAIAAVIAEFDWFTHQKASMNLVESKNISDYIESSLHYISSHSSPATSQLSNYLIEQFRHIRSLFPNDKQIQIAYGVDPPNSLVVNKNGTLTSNLNDDFAWYFWFIIIIILGALFVGFAWWVTHRCR